MKINTDNIREEYYLKNNWKFIKKDSPDFKDINIDESEWKSVKIPHDWAIEGPFSRENDLQIATILEDGITKEVKHPGRTGGLPVAGTAWYRNQFKIPKKDKDKKVYIEFDGVMNNSTVYLNGEKVGFHPYGYTSFIYELTDKIKYGEINTLAVKVAPEPNSSRWYPGAGIYRNVKLLMVNSLHIVPREVFVRTSSVSKYRSKIEVSTGVKNKTNKSDKITLETTIINPQGIKKTSCVSQKEIEDEYTFQQNLTLENPKLWDIENPRLYTLISVLKYEGKIVDEYETSFGIRKISFDAHRGFFLNRKNIKLKGVCQHHDLGPLGAAVNYRALERQLELLKEMGCNAIRTSHNPPASELLELCDKMGFLVIDEAFDEWEKGKVENGYHKYFEDWAEKDLKSMIKRDRNHPCVIMWSIGNEIREQGREDGAEIAQFLTDICHEEDPTRPVTAGFNHPEGAIENGLAEVVDIPGWNYECDSYEKFHKEHPDWIMYGSETESCVSSRGEYFFPAQEENSPVKRENFQISSYDMEATEWGYPPDYEFKAQEEAPYILGEFVWTGFDYLGEPTPYYSEWPSRSSYFGIIDLCGLPKDRYYLYKSHWSDRPTLHLLPHWNWEEKEGEKIPVFCYTNYEAAELFVNGKSYGIKRKNENSVFERYRLMWADVVYEPGLLKVVALDDQGNEVMTEQIHTADSPEKIQLKPDREKIKADGEDLSFIKVSILDRDGNLCPVADNKITFSLEGPGEIAATGNGDPTSTTSFTSFQRKAFNGHCMLIIRSQESKKGKISIRAEAEELIGDEIKLNSV
ncbi:MAG: beta-galactosidase GalB [Bacillota bacterium]